LFRPLIAGFHSLREKIRELQNKCADTCHGSDDLQPAFVFREPLEIAHHLPTAVQRSFISGLTEL